MQIRKLAPGDHLLDYRILEKIGEGGFGEVFRAEHQVLGRIVAIKVPRDLEALSALRLEGVIQATLDHPGIVKTLEISISHDPPYVAMEHVDGLSLAEVLKREGPLNWKRASRILVEAGRALKHAHERGVIHGDVKPGNVLVEPGEDGRIRLTDFGLGRVFEGPNGNVQISRSLELATSGAEVQGTLRYLAPEVQRGEPADERSDIYSWGVLLFETITGKLPEGREVPSDLVKSVPWEVDQVFESCFQRRERRPRSLDSGIAALDRLVVHGPRPRDAVADDDGKASRAIPYPQHDGSLLVKPLPGPRGPESGAPVRRAAGEPTPEQVVATSAEALHVLRMLGLPQKEGALPAAPASFDVVPPASAPVPALPASPAPLGEGVPPSELDLGAATRRARSDAGFARWREAFVAAVRGRFASRPAGASVVPGEGFDLAVGITSEAGDPHHRIYATLLPFADLDTARRFVKASKSLFEREKGVWEKEVTFVLATRDLQDKANVLSALRAFSTGWWRRRRAVLYDLGARKLYATELGCDPRGNPLKRLFFEALEDAARSASPATTTSPRARRECVRGGLVGVGLAFVAMAGLLAGAACIERAAKCRRHRRAPQAPVPAVEAPSRSILDGPILRAAPRGDLPPLPRVGETPRLPPQASPQAPPVPRTAERAPGPAAPIPDAEPMPPSQEPAPAKPRFF